MTPFFVGLCNHFICPQKYRHILFEFLLSYLVMVIENSSQTERYLGDKQTVLRTQPKPYHFKNSYNGKAVAE